MNHASVRRVDTSREEGVWAGGNILTMSVNVFL